MSSNSEWFSAARPALRRAVWLLLAFTLPSAAGAAAPGSVFVSYSADGVPSYASQRLDPSYRLFIRGEETPTPLARTRIPGRPTGEGRPQGKQELTPLIEH